MLERKKEKFPVMMKLCATSWFSFFDYMSAKTSLKKLHKNITDEVILFLKTTKEGVYFTKILTLKKGFSYKIIIWYFIQTIYLMNSIN